jgi:uncharacterized protein YecT (DUF1311 family)
MPENTDFYPSTATGIRTQLAASATCRTIMANGLMFPAGERHSPISTTGWVQARPGDTGTMMDRQNLKSAATRWGAVGMTLAAVLSQSQPAAARQFDCRNAEAASERIICRNDTLGALDEQMSRRYDELMQAYDTESQRKALRNYQRHFLAVRDDCGRDASCIKGAYLDQISVLEARLEKAYSRSER